jgi:hypothetical protein
MMAVRHARVSGGFARAVALCTLVALPADGIAQVKEYDVKAAFLFNFALFTQSSQPSAVAPKTAAGETESYRLCIYGKDPFGATTKTLATRTISGRRIVVKHPGTIEELKHCQLVFIGDTDGESARRAANAISGLPIITVAESKDFPETGIIFNLVVIDEKVAFQVNMQAARDRQLDVSAKLTRLAKNVH